ncbi:DNA-dependent metalloprotease SPRTN-like [Dreissena polymorpha]|uniref:Protein with SprT-like domain at the N terminus n=1 Tax=Dreissena polymorpha TaxID=45954 RepID=A0A9D4KUT8_DREPO|nr:DNA-dependent metalloprotease SPRTN-like [Dreissena polymorpha]KAH3846280.1 hypothetical protein DPMN_088579 [Dreissena polymorpha]
MDEDYALALRLQSEIFSGDTDSQITNSDGQYSKEPKSLVDPFWEMTDPNPDIRALFLQFNDRFFWGRLSGIEVKWSPRMTLCAGLCCYEGRGGLCSVRLSVPLLKLRPRKDLVETLLHEMIHAYLFITDNNKDHDGHGPEFHKHMYRINGESGTKISVYHNFHDEVDAYRQHWWRCNGPCQARKPYFGYVKRSMNRPPSKNDTWWAEHQRTCGGTYTKVKEPESYAKKKNKDSKGGGEKKEKEEKEKPKSKNVDIRIFGGTGKVLGAPKVSIPEPANDGSTRNSATITAKEPSTSSFHKSESPSTNYGKNYFSDSDDGDVSVLPGGKTPVKKIVPKNKPVSQGGDAKFMGGAKKKKKVVEFDWSDSEEDEILLNYSKSMDTNVIHEPTVPSKVFDSSDEDIIDSNILDCDKSTQSLKSSDATNTKFHDSKHSLSSTSTQSDSFTSESTSDIRAMLRKVWGEKRFPDNRGGIGAKNKIFKVGNQSVPMKRLSSDSDQQAPKKPRTNEATAQSAGKKAEKPSGVSLTDAVRNYFADNKLNKMNSSKGDHTSDKPHLTSPIEKMFNKIQEKQTQDSKEHGLKAKPLPESGEKVRESQSQLLMGGASSGSGNERLTMLTCPVCCKIVEMSLINEHLDMCLTMQAIT